MWYRCRQEGEAVGKQRSFLTFFFSLAVSRFRVFVVVRLRSVCDGISLHLRQDKNKQVLSVLALTASTAADPESMTNASHPVSHQPIQKHNNMASEVILQNEDEKGQKSTAKPLENHVNETRGKKVLYQDWQTKNKAWLAKQDSRAFQWLTTDFFEVQEYI